MTSDIQIPVLPMSDPSMFPRAEEQVLGARNLLDVVSSVHTANGTTSGVTITTNNDGTITFSTATTAQANVDYIIGSSADGRLKLSDYPSNIILSKGSSISSQNLLMQVWYYDSSKNYTGFQNESGSGEGEFLLQPQSGDVYFAINFRAISGKAINTTVKPMLRLASDPDSTYTQYAMTNKQITDALFPSNYTTSGLTPVNATIAAGGYVQIGKLVILNIRLTLTAAISNNEVLRGMPTPASQSNNYIAVATSLSQYSAYMNATTIHLLGSVASGTNILLSAVYIGA